MLSTILTQSTHSHPSLESSVDRGAARAGVEVDLGLPRTVLAGLDVISGFISSGGRRCFVASEVDFGEKCSRGASFEGALVWGDDE